MSDKDTGGSAFPYVQIMEVSKGMTLRDYIAIEAMKPIITAQLALSGNGCLSGNGNGFVCRERLSKEAYEMADSMLEAREK